MTTKRRANEMEVKRINNYHWTAQREGRPLHHIRWTGGDWMCDCGGAPYNNCPHMAPFRLALSKHRAEQRAREVQTPFAQAEVSKPKLRLEDILDYGA
jgi:hypothetical protein